MKIFRLFKDRLSMKRKFRLFKMNKETLFEENIK